MRVWPTSLRMLVLLAVMAAMAVSAGVSRQGRAEQSLASPETPLRFETVDVYIDSGATPLGAYQVEVRAVGGDAKLVSVEGGEHVAYSEPPVYDPRALHEGQVNERIVIAAIGEGQLPSGRVRAARLHLAVRGESEYRITLEAAGNPEGDRIEADVELVRDER